jgi:hypothetical protein
MLKKITSFTRCAPPTLAAAHGGNQDGGLKHITYILPTFLFLDCLLVLRSDIGQITSSVPFSSSSLSSNNKRLSIQISTSSILTWPRSRSPQLPCIFSVPNADKVGINVRKKKLVKNTRTKAASAGGSKSAALCRYAEAEKVTPTPTEWRTCKNGVAWTRGGKKRRRRKRREGFTDGSSESFFVAELAPGDGVLQLTIDRFAHTCRRPQLVVGGQGEGPEVSGAFTLGPDSCSASVHLPYAYKVKLAVTISKRLAENGKGGEKKKKNERENKFRLKGEIH